MRNLDKTERNFQSVVRQARWYQDGTKSLIYKAMVINVYIKWKRWWIRSKPMLGSYVFQIDMRKTSTTRGSANGAQHARNWGKGESLKALAYSSMRMSELIRASHYPLAHSWFMGGWEVVISCQPMGSSELTGKKHSSMSSRKTPMSKNAWAPRT